MIEAITFDFWNTLCEGRTAGELRIRHLQRSLEENRHEIIPKARIEHAMAQAWKEWDRVWEQECYTFGAERWTEVVLENLGITLEAPQQEALILAMATSGMQAEPPLVPGLADLLPRLAERYRLGVICDTGLSPGWMLRRWMDRNGILDPFMHLTFSDELGVSKPHPDAFLTTLVALNTAPDAAVHIGDFPRTDIAGAKGVGMRAIRFKGVHDWGDGAVRADAELTSFCELQSLLDQWDHDSRESS